MVLVSFISYTQKMSDRDNRRGYVPSVSAAKAPRSASAEWSMDMNTPRTTSAKQEPEGVRRAHTNSDIFGMTAYQVGGRIFVPMPENSVLNNWNSDDHPWRSRWNTYGMWPMYLWNCFILIISLSSITDVDMTTSPSISRLPFITFYGIVIADAIYSTLTALWTLMLERNWYQYEIKEGGKGVSQWPPPSQMSASMFVGWGFRVTATVFVFILNNDIGPSLSDNQYIMRYKRIAGLMAVGAAFASCEVMMRFFAIVFGRWLIKDDDKAYLKLQTRIAQSS